MGRSAFIAMTLALAVAADGGSVRADTTPDCGRFHLKLDRQTGKMKCVGGSKRKRPGRTVTVQQIRRQQAAVQTLIR